MNGVNSPSYSQKSSWTGLVRSQWRRCHSVRRRTLQPTGVCTEILRRLPAAGLHTALDTCGEGSPKVFAQILDHVNLVMYDIKHSDEKIHRELTGVGLTTIHVNLREAARRAARGDLRLWVRTPLVPGASAEPSVLDAIGRFLRTELHGAVERWELCAFNPACGSKYRRLGMPWDYSDLGLQTDSETSSLLGVAGNAIGRTDVVHLQGIRRGSNRSR